MEDRLTTVTRVRAVTGNYLGQVAASLRRIARPPAVSRLAANGWTSVSDDRLFWFMQTRHDVPALRRTLADLRRLYPGSGVLVVSDGDPNPAIPKAAREHRADFVRRDGVMRVERGGRPVQEMLEAFLQRDADLLIKIDPDTHLRRRLSHVPSRHSVSICGTLQTSFERGAYLGSVQGGCIMIPREAAQRLADSGLLLSDRLLPPALEWALGPVSRARARSGLTSHDWTIGWACREAGLRFEEHPEVFSRYRPSLMDLLASRHMAISHPRFEPRHLRAAAFYVRGLTAVCASLLGRE